MEKGAGSREKEARGVAEDQKERKGRSKHNGGERGSNIQ
jgi:hypothetical protein